MASSKNPCFCFDETVTTKSDGSGDAVESFRPAGVRSHPGMKFMTVQSPIALEHKDSNEYDHFEPLEFHGHWDKEGEASFTNNGFTATVRLERPELPVLRGGPLHEDFLFEQLHFHWSDDDHSGCEHIFEGRAYSMEAHAVHYNPMYGSFENAADKHDGLAVVAFFLQATDDEENTDFQKISDAVKDIVKISSTAAIPSDCLAWVKEQAQCKGYYTYHGSLTTEPYTENVIWIIYPNPIRVARHQVRDFRMLQSSHLFEEETITKNVRPLQEKPELHRIIYARSHKPSI